MCRVANKTKRQQYNFKTLKNKVNETKNYLTCFLLGSVFNIAAVNSFLIAFVICIDSGLVPINIIILIITNIKETLYIY